MYNNDEEVILLQPDKANEHLTAALSKVPEVTLLFWIIKIAATTLGETGGDMVSMSMNLGYLMGTGISAVIFLVAVTAQIRAKQFHPFLYWTTIIATTTVGTTLAEFADRSLGEDGLMVEHWALLDEASMMRQLAVDSYRFD